MNGRTLVEDVEEGTSYEPPTSVTGDLRIGIRFSDKGQHQKHQNEEFSLRTLGDSSLKSIQETFCF